MKLHWKNIDCRLVEREGNHADIETLNPPGKLRVRARAEEADVLQLFETLHILRPAPRPNRSDEGERPFRVRARHVNEEPEVHLVVAESADEADDRTRKGAERRRHLGLGERRLAEVVGVGDVRQVVGVRVVAPLPLVERTGRREDEIRALEQSPLHLLDHPGRHSRVRAVLVHAVIDREALAEMPDQITRGRKKRPEDRGAEAVFPRDAREARAKDPEVQIARPGNVVEGDNERGIDEKVLAGRAHAACPIPEPPHDPIEVPPAGFRPSEPERLHEEHAVVAREPAHQVLAVRPKLRVPVRRGDAENRGPLQGRSPG